MSRLGLTLLELTVVLVILVALGTIVVPMMGENSDQNARTITVTQLANLRQALVGGQATPGFYGDLRRLPDPAPGTPTSLALDQLALQGSQPAFDPATGRGWRGPYLLNDTFVPDAFSTPVHARRLPLDGWGRAIRLDPRSAATPPPLTRTNAPDAALISRGPDGIDGTTDDIVLTLFQ